MPSFGEGAKNQALGLAGMQDQATLISATEKFNVIEQLKNLLTYPAVKRKVEEGEILCRNGIIIQKVVIWNISILQSTAFCLSKKA